MCSIIYLLQATFYVLRIPIIFCMFHLHSILRDSAVIAKLIRLRARRDVNFVGKDLYFARCLAICFGTWDFLLAYFYRRRKTLYLYGYCITLLQKYDGGRRAVTSLTSGQIDIFVCLSFVVSFRSVLAMVCFLQKRSPKYR